MLDGVSLSPENFRRLGIGAPVEDYISAAPDAADGWRAATPQMMLGDSSPLSGMGPAGMLAQYRYDDDGRCRAGRDHRCHDAVR